MPIGEARQAALQAGVLDDGLLLIQDDDDVHDLEGLPFADSVERLHIVRCGGLRSLNGVQDMVNIVELRIVDSDLSGTDLSALCSANAERIRHLDSLQVKNCGIKDLTAFADLQAVSEVDFSDNAIESLAPLARYRHVRVFDASNNQLADIDDCKVIMMFIPLESISLYGNPLTHNMSELARKKLLFALPEDIKHVMLHGPDDEIEQLKAELERVHELPLEEDETYNQHFIMSCYDDLQEMYEEQSDVAAEVAAAVAESERMRREVDAAQQRNAEMLQLYELNLRKADEAERTQRELEELFAQARKRVNELIEEIARNQK